MGVVISRQPDTFTITRSEAISAPPSVPFAVVNDYHKWLDWSPWEGIDPTMTRSYSGAPEGVGAIYGWSGASKVGEGRMTITESRPGERIVMALDFIRPFKANNITEFTFNPRGGHTVVTWSMSGKETFATKAFSLICNRDKIVGTMFQQGLTKMKALCEKAG